jgi:predicted DNA-binding transcriptional regulator AlpA
VHEGLLRTEAAARFLSLSERTLEGLRVRGGGPRFISLSRRAVAYRPEDLEEWVQSRVRRSTSDDGPEPCSGSCRCGGSGA